MDIKPKNSIIQKKKSWFKNQYVRYISQFVFILTVASFLLRKYGYFIQLSGGVHTYCPFGGVEALSYIIPTGNFVRNTNMNNFVLLGGVLLGIMVFGGAFCGWVCPVGTVYEWLYKLRVKVFPKKVELSKTLHNILRYSKYLVLALIIIMTNVTGELWFRKYDPYFGSATLGWGMTIVGISIVIILLLAGLFVERFFCLYLCPFSAVITPLSKISATGIVRNTNTCIDCKMCDKVCPERISVSAQTKIDRANCIQCLACIDNCSVSDALEFKLGW